MSSAASLPKIPIGQQLAALQRLQRLLEVNPKLLASLATKADRDYLMDGLRGGIATVTFSRDNAALITAAYKAAHEQPTKSAAEVAS